MENAQEGKNKKGVGFKYVVFKSNFLQRNPRQYLNFKTNKRL